MTFWGLVAVRMALNMLLNIIVLIKSIIFLLFDFEDIIVANTFRSLFLQPSHYENI